MKTYHKRTSLSEKDTLKAVRHLNGRHVSVSIRLLSEYLSINENAVRHRMRALVRNGIVSHEKSQRADYTAIELSPPPLNVPVQKEPHRNNQALFAFAEDYGYEGRVDR